MVALAAQAVAGIKCTVQAVSPLPPTRRWRLVDRLGGQIIGELVVGGRAGATKKSWLSVTASSVQCEADLEA